MNSPNDTAWAIVAASAVVGLLCALSLGWLRLDIDALSMLPRGRPSFDEFRSFAADFGEMNQLVVMLEGDDLFELQRFADALGTRLARLDTVADVRVRLDFERLSTGLLSRRLFNYIPEEVYDDVERRLAPAAIEARIAANRALLSAPFDLTAAGAIARDPLGLQLLAAEALARSYGDAAPATASGYFVAPDGHSLLVFVRPTASPFDIAFSRALVQQVRDAVTQTRAAIDPSGALHVAYTGGYLYALEDEATLKTDIVRYTVLALIGVMAVFVCGYRNLRILPFVTYPLLLATLVAFALSAVFYQQLNAVSLCFAAILYGLAIDSSIHYYTRVLEERRGSADLRGAVTAALAGLARPNIASSATTAAAFAAIGISVLPPVSQIGVLTALGMGVSTVLFFVLCPALTFALAGSFSATGTPAETPRLERLASVAVRRARLITLCAVLVGMLLLVGARGVQLDVELTHLRPRDSEAVRVQQAVDARFALTPTNGAVVVRRPDLDAALAASEQVARRLRIYRAEGLVSAVYAIDGVLPSAQTQRERLRRFNRLPRAAAAESMREALGRHRFNPQPFAAFMDGLATAREVDASVVRLGDPDLEPLASLVQHHVQQHDGSFIVATYVQPSDGVGFGTIARRLHQDLAATPFAIASRDLLQDELGAVLRTELRWFCVCGIAGNLLLLFLLFRRIGTAVAILAPVVLVIVALFAAMAATGIPLDPVNLIATPILFGIGVDYSIYVAARARECGNVPRALRLAGRALVVSALTTIAGFGFLALSRYPFLAMLGLLTAIGLFLCLLLSIVLLPALLTLVDRSNAANEP